MSRSTLVMFFASFVLSLGANGQNYSVTIEVDPVLASYTVGSNVTLQCVVDPVIIDTSITPTYSWQCDTSCFADGLITRNITRQLTDMDSGLIECSVTIDGDEYMSDNMFDLQVSQAPSPIITFNPTSPITGAIVGSPQDIDCIVNTTVPGVSSVSVSWTGPGGVPVLSNTNRMTINPTTSSGNIFTSSLQFDYLMEGDEGTYTCNVMILDASATQSIELQPLTVPTPVVSITPPITQIVSLPLELQCSGTTVRGITSRVDIVWISGGMELERMNGVSSTTMDDSLVYTHSYTIPQLNTTYDGRVIQCEVVINASSSVMATDSITLDVTVPTPTVTISPSGPIQGAMVGSSQVINCTVNTISGVESSSVMISWMGPGGNIDATNGRVSIGSVTDDGNNMYTRSLQFTYLTEDDENTYSCDVMILETGVSQMVNLQPLTIPTPTVSVTAPNTQTVGQSLTLDCSVTTVRGITSIVDIVWSSNDTELERMNGVSSTTMDNSLVYTHNYTISQLSTTDDGRVIQCEVVINSSPTVTATGNITLDVMVPTFMATTALDPVNSQPTVGRDEDIVCTVSGIIGVEPSALMISWFGPQGRITNDSDSRLSIIPTTFSNNAYISRLLFEYLVEDDEGNYTCNVAILDDSTSSVIWLQSFFIMMPDGTLRNLTTPTLNEQLTLQCEATVTRGVTSPVDIIWSRNNGTEILQRVNGANSTSRGDMLVFTDTYTTPMLTEDDNGMMYTCTVSINTTPDRRSEIDPFILALHIPTPTVSMTAPNTQTVGQSLTLQCEVTTVRGITSRVDIVWRSNGTELEGMNVSSTTISNSTVYTGSYTISQLSTTDDGRVIQCEVVINANPPVTATDSITLDVMAPTFMTTTALEPINSQPTVGRTEDIICTVSGISGVEPSALMISWLGPRGSIITNDSDSRLSIIPTTLSGNTYISHLLFEYLVEEDEGNYTCNVAILDDSTSSVFQLQSFFIRMPDVTLTNLTIPTLNEQLTMQCEATVTRGVTSPVDIIWSRNNGTEILQRVDGANSTSRRDMLVFTDNYTTPMLTEDDNGMMYACTVSINTTPDRRSGNDFFILALHTMQRPIRPIVRGAVTTPTSVNISWTVQSIVYDMEQYVVYYDTDSITLTSATEVIMGNSDLNTLNELFSVYIDGLTPFTTYFYIISATNTVGTTYTTVMSFMTNETVPNPIVLVTSPNTQTVGQSLTLQCEVTTVKGITSRVDIVWSSGGIVLRRINGTTATTMDNSQVYTDSYTISQLSTTDDDRVIQCEAVINTSPLIQDDDRIALDVIVPPPAVIISPSGPIQGAMVGSPQVINCTVSTVSGVESSSVMISWMGPGGDPITTDCRVTISPTTSSSNTYTSSLQFGYLMEGDEGTYTCNVMILKASGSDSVELSLNSACSSTSSTDSQASSDDNNGATVIVLIVMVVIMAIGLIVAIAVIILLMRKVKQLKSQYVISQREGSSIKVKAAVTKLPKKSEVIYEAVDTDETEYAKPTAVSATQSTAISMQENPAYRVNKPKI